MPRGKNWKDLVVFLRGLTLSGESVGGMQTHSRLTITGGKQRVGWGIIAIYTKSYGRLEEELNPKWWDEENCRDRELPELALKAEGKVLVWSCKELPEHWEGEGHSHGVGRVYPEVEAFPVSLASHPQLSGSFSPALLTRRKRAGHSAHARHRDICDQTQVSEILAEFLKSGFCILSLPLADWLALGLSGPSCH